MTDTQTTTTPDMAEVERFLDSVVSDAGAAVSVLLTYLGDKLGLYAAMADGQEVTAAELARRTGTHERLVQEWLNNQAVGGYVEISGDRFRLPLEHAIVLADEHSPVFVQGVTDMVEAVYRSSEKQLEVFRTGTGLAWGDQDEVLFGATERSFASGYEANLVQDWVPAIQGLAEVLESGAQVAEIGCGYGAASIVLAQAYPTSRFVGYDYHEPSIRVARERAQQAGAADRVEFRVADATALEGSYDLVAFFDCWHDTADPLGVARAARAALAPGGVVMLVEPYAEDTLEGNRTPLGRFTYGISTVVCTPCSVSDGGPGLGTLAGEARTRELFTAAGFGTFRRATQTPTNIVYEARP